MEHGVANDRADAGDGAENSPTGSTDGRVISTRETRSAVGEAIQARRAELGLSVLELAEQSGVVRQTIQNAEAGRTVMRAENRGAMEKALRWPPGALTAAYLRGVMPPIGQGSQRNTGPPPPTSKAGDPPDDLIDPSIVQLFGHPDLDSDTRKALARRLRRLQREFAEESRDLFGLKKEE